MKGKCIVTSSVHEDEYSYLIRRIHKKIENSMGSDILRSLAPPHT
jgi:hypothetical protein